MGGIIASTLAFCILYTGKLYNKDINFGNSFLKNEKNCIGVITFGSPSFLFNKEVGIEMIGFSSYFCNIKDSSDYIPIILDSINTLEDFNELFDILKEHEFKENGYEINLEDELKKEFDIYNSVRIPFGFYYMMENALNLSLKLMTGDDFEELIKFMSNSNVLRSNINIYSKISSKAEFNKKHLEFFEKDNKLEYIKILRRKIDGGFVKGIIKFKFAINFGQVIISPDIIDKIELKSCNRKKYEIESKDIYYTLKK